MYFITNLVKSASSKAGLQNVFCWKCRNSIMFLINIFVLLNVFNFVLFSLDDLLMGGISAHVSFLIILITVLNCAVECYCSTSFVTLMWKNTMHKTCACNCNYNLHKLLIWYMYMHEVTFTFETHTCVLEKFNCHFNYFNVNIVRHFVCYLQYYFVSWTAQAWIRYKLIFLAGAIRKRVAGLCS